MLENDSLLGLTIAILILITAVISIVDLATGCLEQLDATSVTHITGMLLRFFTLPEQIVTIGQLNQAV